MTKVPATPYTGALTIDATSLGGLLFDLPRGATQHLRREKPGFEAVLVELANNIVDSGDAAGISPNVYARFVDHTTTITKLREVHAVVDKLLEVIRESEAKYVDERENDLSIMADAVRSVVKRTGNPALQAPFETMLRYNAQTADKAARTRRLNAAIAEGDKEPEG